MNPALMYAAMRVNGRRTGAAPAPEPDGLTLQLAVDYVDTSGVLQTAVADSFTTPTITGVAPFFVWFDGTASISEATDATTPGAAWRRMNCRFDTGEGLSGTWSLTGANKNVIEGPGAVMGHVYTTVGTHHATMERVDSDGRVGTISIDVVVTDPGAGTNINTGGSWPTWVSGTVYNLAAGTDHSGKGTANLNGVHNVLIRKTGSGADPIVSKINWDNRNVVGTSVTRTRNCRIENINVAVVEESSIGQLHCAVVNHSGTLQYVVAALMYYWPVEASTQTERDNMAYVRGLAFWNCARIASSPDNYVYITQAKNVVFRNCVLAKTTGDSGQHVFRGDYDGLDLQLNQLLAEANSSTYVKVTGWENGSTFDSWPANDRYGPSAGGTPYKPVTQKIVVRNNILGGTGGNNVTGLDVEVLPENDEAGSPDQGHRMTVVNGNRKFTNVAAALWMRGQDTLCYDNLINMGAGASFGVSLTQRPNRVPASLDGPNSETAPPAFP